MSVSDTCSEPCLRFCFTICLLLMAKWTSLFSQYFKGLGINPNSNCKDDRRKLSLIKMGGLKTLNQHICFQELHWTEISKDSSFTSGNSKNVLAASPVTAQNCQCFLVSNAGRQHFLACLCKVKRISQGGFLGYDTPNRLQHVSTEKPEWHAFHFKRQIDYMPENSKNILFNVTTKKISKIWSMKQFYQINHVHSWCVWLYLDYLLYKDHYPWYKTVTY